MDVSSHVDHLDTEGRRLLAAAEQADLDAPVSHCPGWTVADALVHVGGIHRWAADIVGNARSGFDTEAGAAVGTAAGTADLVDWVRRGHAELVATLRAAPADLDCATFLPAPSPLAFWARRQALETTIHRVDVEIGAAVTGEAIDSDLALDGIEEILTGFGARRHEFTPATLRIEPGEAPARRLRLTGERATVEPDGGEPTDATVRGPADQVYRWLWNRPSAVTISGDPQVAGQWAGVQVRWE
jgi:uncharacterized protein (TIGR03083 family)